VCEVTKKVKVVMALCMAVAGLCLLVTGLFAAKPKVKEYKIGAIFSVTGKAAFLGEPEKKTVEMLVEELNKKGGINGIPVRVIVEDDAGDENQTKMAASKLIDRDNVLAIIGPSRTGNSMAIKDMMREKKVPLLSCAAAEAIVDPLNPWVFKTPQKDSYVAILILREMKKEKITKIAMLYDNTAFGQEGYKQVKEAAGRYKVNIVMAEAFEPTATENDIETLLTKVKAKGDVQAVVTWTILPTQSIVPKKMKSLNMKQKLFLSHGFGNIKYVRAAGAAANGIMFPAGRLLVAESLPDSNKQKKSLVIYKKAYESRYKEAVSTFGGHAYDAFWITVNAIKKAGPDRAKIRKEIENTRFVGTGGIFAFTAKDHNGLGLDSLEMLTVRDGRFALLYGGKGKK
jgi:branched-chain amino acid transport system substrate-binding protein